MFFRFVAGLVLVVLISMISILLEKQTLEMKRAVTRQYFQKDILLELHAKHRLQIQRLTAPVSGSSPLMAQVPESADREWRMPGPPTELAPSPRSSDSAPPPRRPLMRWEHPVRTQPQP